MFLFESLIRSLLRCNNLCIHHTDQRIISAGIKWSVFDLQMEGANPEAFTFLMSFARDYELPIREGRHGVRHAVQRQAQAA